VLNIDRLRILIYMHNRTKVPDLTRKVWFTLIFCIFSQLTYATHIVGGELNYTHIEDDSYEISLTIFRDCYNANPNVFFDDTVSIGVYDPFFNFLVEDIRIPFDTLLNDTLSPVLYNDCLIIPPAVCVHTTVYKDTIDLPYNSNGYVLVYQRCCRNGTINNIVAPLETGATFSVFISPKALEIKNSSPKFQSWPPIYICAEFPINYDQSAIDENNDSIAYKLCTPLKGGGSPPNGNPIPQPPAGPPYEPVEWFDPPYNESNMLNAFPGSPLLIDATTGTLTGIPNTVGQFVVGICLEEFRNDTLISTIRRDFQYNVGLCGNPTASFFSPEIQCSSDSVVFTNESTNSDNFLWTFDLINNPGITSEEESPSYLYDEYGTYTVQLISEPFTICADTFLQEITLLPPGMNPEIEYDIISCEDNFEIQFFPVVNSFGSAPVEYTWTFSNNMTIYAESPTLFFPSNTGFLTVQLEILGSEGCIYDATTTLYLNEIEEELDFDSQSICVGDSIFVNQSYDLTYSFEWSPNTNISNPFVPNPLIYPDSTTLYTLIVEDNAGCQKALEVFIQVNENPNLTLPDSIIICENELILDIEPVDFEYIWTSDLEKQDTIGSNESLPLIIDTELDVFLHAIDPSTNCKNSEVITIQNQEIESNNPLPDYLVCPLTVISINLDDYLNNYDSISWNTSSTFVLNQEDNILEFLPVQQGWDTLGVFLSNDSGCDLNEEFTVYLFDTLNYGNFSIKNCANLEVEFSTNLVDHSILSWNFGENDTVYNFAQNQTINHVYAEAGSYTAAYWIESLEACADTIFIPVVIEDSPIDYGLNLDILNCEDELELEVSSFFNSNQFDLDSALININDESSNATALSVSLNEPTDINVEFYFNDGCKISLEEFIDWNINEPITEQTLDVCKNTQIEIQSNLIENQTINWLPNAVFEGSSEEFIVHTAIQNELFIAEITTNIQNAECISYDTVALQVIELSPAEIEYEHIDCETNTFNISLINSLDYETFTWNLSNSSITNENPISIQTDSSSTLLYLEAVDSFGCELQDSLLIENLLAELSDTLFSPCYPDTSIFVFNTPENYSSSWSSDNGIFETWGDSIIMPFSEFSNYQLVLTDPWNCKDSLNVIINGNNELEGLELVISQDTIISGEDVTIQSNLTNLILYEFIYNNFVYLQSDYSIIITPEEHTTISLMATDENGCSASAEITITVLDPKCDFPYVFVPNTFTPNGDMENDFFKIEGNFIEYAIISIYDRWGERIFYTEDKDEYWDGTYKNQELDSDTYAYFIELGCLGGETRTLKGNISLIR
jgi:gliding motility-associated-like protein